MWKEGEIKNNSYQFTNNPLSSQIKNREIFFSKWKDLKSPLAQTDQ